ncbi:MAG: selenium metabolism-associated LysR family transcriptional regulator [Thermodesulfobacteriota bacterium]
MDLHRLEVFCRVVDLRSFTRAAEAARLSQPTVSEHVRVLEELLGQKLVDRLGREVLPTAAGRTLYQYARRILDLREEAKKAISHQGLLAGKLLLGASTIPGTYLLPECVARFKRQHPSLQLCLRIASSHLIARDVLAGELEAGVIGDRWPEPSLEWEEIFLDELVLVVFPSHPWAGRDSIHVGELAGQPFIIRERESGTRAVMGQALTERGLDVSRLAVAAEIGSTEAVRQCVKAGIGISILSRQAVAEDLAAGTLCAVSIDGQPLFRPFHLVRQRNRELSSACALFLEAVRSENQLLFHRAV